MNYGIDAPLHIFPCVFWFLFMSALIRIDPHVQAKKIVSSSKNSVNGVNVGADEKRLTLARPYVFYSWKISVQCEYWQVLVVFISFQQTMDHQINQDNGSPSMSKAEDNLSNSDGPLLRKREISRDPSFARENLRSSIGGVFSTSSIRRERWRQNSSGDMKNYSENEGKQSNHCLWMITFILGIIGLCNLLLSTTVIIVLRVSQGMEALEVITDEKLVKFYGNTDLDRVCLERGIFEGYGDEPIQLLGDNGGVSIDVTSRIRGEPRSSIQVFPNATSVSRVDSFEIKDPRTGNTYFSTNFPNFGLPAGVLRIDVNAAETRRVAAPMNESLSLKSKQKIVLNGAEGATIESKNIIWTANNDIFFGSTNGDIVLDTKQGLFIDVKNIPIVPTYLPNRADINGQYKVCVCMPQGKLFRVPIKPGGSARVNCARVSISPGTDPCQ